MTDIVNDLRELSNEIGVPGFESRVRALISSKAEAFADDLRVDALGNLVATKRGSKGGRTVLLDAHMDEVGFIVSHVDGNGFIRFEELGGWDDRNLLGHPVRFPVEQGFVDGVIGTKPPHLQKPDEREKVVKREQMFVDIGASSREDAEEVGIAVGTPFTIYHEFREMLPGRVMGKAFDDRSGCALLLNAMERLGETSHESEFVFNFAVCEEIGGRGATTGAYGADPDIALALENTAAGDIPGIPEERCPTSIGRGPAITIADKSLIAHPEVIRRLRDAARESSVEYQIKKPLYGGTDAGRIAITRRGVPSGVLSVPSRYIHNGISMLAVSDLEACSDLLLSFCAGLG